MLGSSNKFFSSTRFGSNNKLGSSSASSRCVKAIALTASAVALASLGTLGAPNAYADGSHDGLAEVNAQGGLRGRSAPSVTAPQIASLANHQQVRLLCQASGTGFKDDLGYRNTNWLLVSVGKDSSVWVPAVYLYGGDEPTRECGNEKSVTGRATTGVNLREGPTTKDRITGGLKKGAKVTLTCRITAAPKGLSQTWYQTSSGKWVAAKYVKATSKPAPCR